MTFVVDSETSSLYEFAIGSTAAPFATQVGPVTFKTLMSNLLDLLVEQGIPAQIWTKLPKGGAWQTELDRYAESPLPQHVYVFQNQRDEVAKESITVSENLRFSSTIKKTVSISLPIESPLRREYFLLIWSEKVCALLVAQRAKASKDGDSSDVDEGADKKPALMTVLSLDARVVRSAIAMLHPYTPDAAPEAFSFESIPPFLIDQLLAKQIQRQEELWQRANSHRRQAETASLLQLQNDELLNTVRLKDEFLNTVSQELRTPLTNMKTALTLLNSPSLKPPQRQRYMELLVKECDRQSSLIRSLMDLMSLDQMVEQATVHPLRLSEIVPGVVSTYQPLAEEKGVRLAYTVPENLPAISCVNQWVKQIVINLLHNGVKFTPRGGQVWVRAKQQGEYVQLEFKDTGIGIPPGEIPKIFDRFYRVRQTIEDASGAGLGLTIVQQLLLHCGGSISVKSRIGEGSTFNVLLPIHRQPTEKPQA
jgi:signal transduction histidine kinase